MLAAGIKKMEVKRIKESPFSQLGSSLHFKLISLHKINKVKFRNGEAFKKRLSYLREAISLHQTAIINRLDFGKAGQMGAYRFMHNDRVKLSALKQELHLGCGATDIGHVLVLQDTSQYTFKSGIGRFKEEDEHIGVLADNSTLGIHAHTAIAFDAQQGYPIGFSDLQLYSLARNRTTKHERGYKQQPIEEKHSYRWLSTVENSAKCLEHADQITIIADREADVYQVLANSYDERVQLLIRSSHNRTLRQNIKLHTLLKQLPWMGNKSIELAGNRNRKGRRAELRLRWSEVELKKSPRVVEQGKQYADFLKINVLEVKEVNPPLDSSPIHWYLYTTHAITTEQEALQIVRWYEQRWWIEDFFRLTKQQGFELEKSQFGDGMALKRLIHIVFGEALKVFCLRQGRQAEDQGSQHILSQAELQTLKTLSADLQGKSAYQKCPYQPTSLAWAAWLIARLGGWTSASMDKRPPGVITLLRGYRRLKDQTNGFQAAWNILFKNASP